MASELIGQTLVGQTSQATGIVASTISFREAEEDIVEIVESSNSVNDVEEPEVEEKEKMDEVKEDDIWNIDSIVKKNNKKTKKGVIRFAEDIEDLKS